jgi:hypothetical protein
MISGYIKQRINIMMDLRERGCWVNRTDNEHSDSVPGYSRSSSFAGLQFCLYVEELM